MELILIRHGKAQKRGSIFPDHQRKLVTKGINQLNEDIPFLNEYLRSKKQVYLWSSNILRAMESAEIIKNICSIAEIKVQDFIGHGDFDGLSRRLKQMQEGCTIIIVGHEPDLSNWTQLICNKTVDFKKGAVAEIKINSINELTIELTGKLIAFAEPGNYRQLLS